MNYVSLHTRFFTLLIAFLAVLMLPTEAKADNNPLCFTAKGGSVTVTFDIKNVTHTIQYSTDGTNWNNYTSNTNTIINDNSSIYFRANDEQSTASPIKPFGNANNLSNSSRFYFQSSDGGTIEASGNIMSLYGPNCPDLQLPEYAFAYLFQGCTLFKKAPELPATQLATCCYLEMFKGCTALTAPPALPATTLKQSCYCSMFEDCTTFTTLPETLLVATTMASSCYEKMFKGCTNLTTPPSLPATNLASFCYNHMFDGCTSLVNAPALPATDISESCYGAMFLNCTALTNPPALNATYLWKGCYENMFQGCTALVNPPALPATIMADNCYRYMFKDCKSIVNAPQLPGTTMATRCYWHMFDGCAALKMLPELPATTVRDYCYSAMFYGCKSIKSTPALPATTLAVHCYDSMFRECTSLVSICDLPATTLVDFCYSGMFYKCSSLVVNLALPGKVWKIPATSIPTDAQNALGFMFGSTGGDLASYSKDNSDPGTPEVNTDYYISYQIKVTANDGAWNEDANWCPQGVPVITDVVTILHDITIPAGVNAHCESIQFGTSAPTEGDCAYISPGSECKLTVSPSATLHATTIINSTASKLTIQSDESNTGTIRFSNSGTDGLKATVEMYLKGTAYKGDDDKFYPDWQYRGFIGTPDANQTLQNLVIYQWDETKNNTDYWVSNSPSPWNGFAIANFDAAKAKRSYTTTLFSTNVPHTYDNLTRTTTGDGNATAHNCGVNLITNSYSAPINMDEVAMNEYLEHTFYFFNTRTYSSYKQDEIAAIITYPKVTGNYLQSSGTYPTTASPYIPAGQSFAVRVNTNESEGTLTIPATAIATVSSGAMYAPAHTNRPGMVKITVEGDEAIDNLFLLEMEECTSDFDNGYDGTKMFSSTSHQIYAQNSCGQCAVNADRSLLGQYVGFKPQSNTSQEVRLLISSRYLDGYDELYLYDYVADRYVEITGNEVSYSFTSAGDETPRRFQIVGKTLDGTEYNPKEKARIEVAGNEIWLMNFDRDDAQVILTDAAGRPLWSVNAKNGTTFTLPDLPRGVYFVSCGKVTTKYVQR